MPDNFAFYLFVSELADVRSRLYVMEQGYRAAGNVVAAQAIKVAFDKHLAGLETLSFEISAAGTDILREKERHSRVRPDTGGEGGPRLEDSLFCDPLTQLPGSVGVANQSILGTNVPWWSTNEEGSSARVGSRLYGFFDPGGSIPSTALAGEHPLFTPTSAADGEGGWMTIHKPIPERRFVQRSIPEITALWKAGFEALKRELMAEVAAAARL